MDIIALSVPIFVLLIVLELGLNIMRKAGFYRFNDSISNLSAGMIQQALRLLPQFLFIMLYLWVFQNTGYFAALVGPDRWWSWLLLFIIIDFQYYWFHRASHRIALFWSGHVVHHQSEEYNLTVALRQSILQSFYAIPFNIPLAIVGFSIEMVIIVGALNTIAQFWIHTRFIQRLPRFLEFWLNTPSHHRVHHGRNPRYIDKNYAGAFILWDRLFGTFEAEDDSEPVVYGITVATKSWDPIAAQFETFTTLLKQAKQHHCWSKRLKLLMMPPGWTPETGPANLQMQARLPYNPPLAKAQVLRLSLAFLACFVAVFVSLTFEKQLSTALLIGLACLSMLGLWWIGKQMDSAPSDENTIT